MNLVEHGNRKILSEIRFVLVYTGTSNFNNKQITKADNDKNIEKKIFKYWNYRTKIIKEG